MALGASLRASSNEARTYASLQNNHAVNKCRTVILQKDRSLEYSTLQYTMQPPFHILHWLNTPSLADKIELHN
jgi:hypothetical protein